MTMIITYFQYHKSRRVGKPT